MIQTYSGKNRHAWFDPDSNRYLTVWESPPIGEIRDVHRDVHHIVLYITNTDNPTQPWTVYWRKNLGLLTDAQYAQLLTDPLPFFVEAML